MITTGVRDVQSDFGADHTLHATLDEISGSSLPFPLFRDRWRKFGSLE